MDLAGVACKYDARNLNLALLPDNKEILIILFRFSRAKSFTVNGLLEAHFFLT